jgi:hypothetical protein
MARKKKQSSASQELVRYHFDNVYDLNEHVEAMQPIAPHYADNLLKFATDGVYKNVTHEQLRSKAVNGCKELYEKHFAKGEFNAESYADKRLDYQHAATGLYVDVGAYVQGLPECFIDEVYVEDSANKFVDIVINIGAPATVNNSAIINKLKGVVSLIDSIESKGARVSVSIASRSIPSSSPHAPYEFTMVLKRHEQPLNIEQLIFLAGSPITLRYFMLLSSTQHAGATSGGYYTCTEHDKEMMDDPSIIYIPSMYYDLSNYISDYSDLASTYNLNIQNALL